MMNVTQLIERFGGYGAAQVLFGVSRPTLALWESEGIPAKRWAQIAELAKLKGKPELTVDTLSRVSPSPPKKKSAA